MITNTFTLFEKYCSPDCKGHLLRRNCRWEFRESTFWTRQLHINSPVAISNYTNTHTHQNWTRGVFEKVFFIILLVLYTEKHQRDIFLGEHRMKNARDVIICRKTHLSLRPMFEDLFPDPMGSNFSFGDGYAIPIALTLITSYGPYPASKRNEYHFIMPERDTCTKNRMWNWLSEMCNDILRNQLQTTIFFGGELERPVGREQIFRWFLCSKDLGANVTKAGPLAPRCHDGCSRALFECLGLEVVVWYAVCSKQRRWSGVLTRAKPWGLHRFFCIFFLRILAWLWNTPIAKVPKHWTKP